MSDAHFDILSDILELLRLRGEVLCSSELTAPWGLRFEPDNALFFHVIERGTCFLSVGGSDWVEASAGDLLILPEGRGHVLASARAGRAVPIMSLVDPRGALPGKLRHGGGGAEASVLCGRFRFDEQLRMAALPGLPQVVHVRGAQGKPPEWLKLTMQFLAMEAHSDQPGRELALSRLVDLLFIQAIRHWMATNDAPPLTWMGATRDPRMAAALTRIHAEPEQPWNVDTLASEAGMSRSSFAERFVELVGEPPSRYLTRWRMHHAARLLRTPGTTVAEIASRVGYDSEAAFSRAFKRYLHVTPSELRQDAAPAKVQRKKNR